MEGQQQQQQQQPRPLHSPPVSPVPARSSHEAASPMLPRPSAASAASAALLPEAHQRKAEAAVVRALGSVGPCEQGDGGALPTPACSVLPAAGLPEAACRTAESPTLPPRHVPLQVQQAHVAVPAAAGAVWAVQQAGEAPADPWVSGAYVLAHDAAANCCSLAQMRVMPHACRDSHCSCFELMAQVAFKSGQVIAGHTTF
jgi:hypothetical protein